MQKTNRFDGCGEHLEPDQEGGKRMQNALTVDVEDWYMTNGLDIDPSRWHEFEERVVPNTLELLELFEAYGVKATFFILGCVAERYPSLVEQIARKGHEIGSHGGWHRLLTTLTLDQFREDLRYSKRVLENISGRIVRLYRAPSWSVVPERYEVLRILKEEGFDCDSSMQPFRTPISGAFGTPHEPFEPVLGGKLVGVVEFPPTVLKLASVTIPFSGGFYLRAVPYPIVQFALKRVNRTRPGMIYVHPWEIDPDPPRIQASAFIRFIQYYRLAGTKRKLERLLKDFSFAPLGSLLHDRPYPHFSLDTIPYQGEAGK
jgi:polysaccharide deacetylase family protein (PEP-CTERM system associated)